MNKRTSIFLVLSISIISSLYAQEDSTEAPYPRLTKFPLLSTDYFYYGDSDVQLDSRNGEIGLEEWSTAIQYTLPLKEKKLYFSNRLQYVLFRYNLKLEDIPTTFKRTFHSVAYTAGLVKILSKKWALAVNVSPTLATDFEQGLSSDDFILQASAMALKRTSRYFQYGIGLVYTTRFGNAIPFPLLNLTYKKKRWSTLVLLPAYASQYYTLKNEKLRVGLKLAPFGNLYNARFDSNFTTLDLNRLAYSRITFGPDVRIKVVGDLFLNISSGIAFRNILEFQDDDLNREIDFRTDNKFFFNVGMKILK